MTVIQLGLHLRSLSLHILKFSLQLLDLLVVFQLLEVGVGVFQLLELSLFEPIVLLLSEQLLRLLLGLNFNLIGVLRLLLDLLVKSGGHVGHLFSEHMQSLFSLL